MGLIKCFVLAPGIYTLKPIHPIAALALSHDYPVWLRQSPATPSRDQDSQRLPLGQGDGSCHGRDRPVLWVGPATGKIQALVIAATCNA